MIKRRVYTRHPAGGYARRTALAQRHLAVNIVLVVGSLQRMAWTKLKVGVCGSVSVFQCTCGSVRVCAHARMCVRVCEMEREVVMEVVGVTYL